MFAERRYAGTSVEEIATRAGYTIGVLYAHFSGKRELFRTLSRTSRSSPRAPSFTQRIRPPLSNLEEMDGPEVPKEVLFSALRPHFHDRADAHAQ
ncbi:helix-turn-helix domain-containing protein [Sinosporangium album]|uniref:helix-turn-helix domain-containing protein n=1 Tax=Sinosporangium album TaxID=504805 RepID=UPI001FDF310E|nr:helix-turn-helix domain-containing protein [Sinosporangium album]